MQENVELSKRCIFVIPIRIYSSMARQTGAYFSLYTKYMVLLCFVNMALLTYLKHLFQILRINLLTLFNFNFNGEYCGFL